MLGDLDHRRDSLAAHLLVPCTQGSPLPSVRSSTAVPPVPPALEPPAQEPWALLCPEQSLRRAAGWAGARASPRIRVLGRECFLKHPGVPGACHCPRDLQEPLLARPQHLRNSTWFRAVFPCPPPCPRSAPVPAVTRPHRQHSPVTCVQQRLGGLPCWVGRPLCPPGSLSDLPGGM